MLKQPVYEDPLLTTKLRKPNRRTRPDVEKAIRRLEEMRVKMVMTSWLGSDMGVWEGTGFSPRGHFRVILEASTHHPAKLRIEYTAASLDTALATLAHVLDRNQQR